MKMRLIGGPLVAMLSVCLACLAGCGPSEDTGPGGTGGGSQDGSTSGTGGRVTTGSGGSVVSSTGGAPGTGGRVAGTGGAMAGTGGEMGTGGAAAGGSGGRAMGTGGAGGMAGRPGTGGGAGGMAGRPGTGGAGGMAGRPGTGGGAGGMAGRPGTGGAGGGGAGGGGAGGAGTGGRGTGGRGTGGATALACPPTLPAAGPCTGANGLLCSYGDAPRPECRDRATCMNGNWVIQESACPPPLETGCPATAPAEGDMPACTGAMSGGYCLYATGNGVECRCIGSAAGGMLVCNRPEAPAAPCPAHLPNAGSACPMANELCRYPCAGQLYSTAVTATCMGGAWIWIQQNCVGPG